MNGRKHVVNQKIQAFRSTATTPGRYRSAPSIREVLADDVWGGSTQPVFPSKPYQDKNSDISGKKEKTSRSPLNLPCPISPGEATSSKSEETNVPKLSWVSGSRSSINGKHPSDSWKKRGSWTSFKNGRTVSRKGVKVNKGEAARGFKTNGGKNYN